MNMNVLYVAILKFNRYNLKPCEIDSDALVWIYIDLFNAHPELCTIESAVYGPIWSVEAMDTARIA